MKEAIQSVQCLTDKAKEWWNKFTGPIGLVINALLNKVGLGEAEIEKFRSQGGKLGQFSDQMQISANMALKLGYRCVYVLIDKVDESSLTGQANTSFEFIPPLLSDLHTLEAKSFGFKFFLWDLLIDPYREVARPDRVNYYQLKWDDRQLVEMLSRRLLAYSGDRVATLASICADVGKDIDRMVVLFAQGSPRNIIRICKEILTSKVNSRGRAIRFKELP